MAAAVPTPRATDTERMIVDAARHLLFDEGWEAVSHQRVAEVAGVGRATVYRHWPARVALLHAAFAAEVLVMHADLTGDLRQDLTAELEAMRREMTDRRAGRVMIALADRALWEPELAAVKEAVVQEGLSTLRRVLAGALADGRLAYDLVVDHAVSVLAGAMVYRFLIMDHSVTKADTARLVDDFLARYGRDLT